MRNYTKITLSLILLLGLVARPGNAGLIAEYLFNGNALDSGPNALNGTVNGATLVADRFGNPNSAYLFDGINDYIQLPGSSLFTPHSVAGGTIRMSAWVKVLAVNTDGHYDTRQPVVSLGRPGEWGYAMYVNDSRSVAGNWWQQNGSNNAYAGGGSIALNQWFKIETEYRRNEFLRVYLNGVLVGENTSNFFGQPYTGMTFGPWIGARRDGEFLNAVIDDVRFYNNAIPEPSSLFCFAGALAGIGIVAMRRRRSVT